MLTLSALALSVSATPAAAAEPNLRAVVAVLPFVEHSGPRVVVDLAPAGSPPMEFILDTGSPSLISSAAARAMAPTLPASSKSLTLKTGFGPSFKFPIVAVRLQKDEPTLEHWALLGADHLTAYVVEIDFAARRVQLLSPQHYEVPERPERDGDAIVQLAPQLSRTFALLSLEGKALPMRIDTGAAAAIAVSEQHVIRANRKPSTLPALGLEPGGQPRYLWDIALGLGDLTLSNVPTLVTRNAYRDEFDLSQDLVGLDVLSRFLVRIDYPNKRMLLRPQRGGNMSWLGVDRAVVESAGAYLRTAAGGFVVAGVLPNTPAAELGLRIGDYLGRDVLQVETAGELLQKIEARELLLVSRPESSGTRRDILLPTQ